MSINTCFRLGWKMALLALALLASLGLAACTDDDADSPFVPTATPFTVDALAYLTPAQVTQAETGGALTLSSLPPEGTVEIRIYRLRDFGSTIELPQADTVPVAHVIVIGDAASLAADRVIAHEANQYFLTKNQGGTAFSRTDYRQVDVTAATGVNIPANTSFFLFCTTVSGVPNLGSAADTDDDYIPDDLEVDRLETSGLVYPESDAYDHDGTQCTLTGQGAPTAWDMAVSVPDVAVLADGTYTYDVTDTLAAAALPNDAAYNRRVVAAFRNKATFTIADNQVTFSREEITTPEVVPGDSFKGIVATKSADLITSGTTPSATLVEVRMVRIRAVGTNEIELGYDRFAIGWNRVAGGADEYTNFVCHERRDRGDPSDAAYPAGNYTASGGFATGRADRCVPTPATPATRTLYGKLRAPGSSGGSGGDPLPPPNGDDAPATTNAVSIDKQWVFPVADPVYAAPAAIALVAADPQYSVVTVDGVTNKVLVKPATGTDNVREDVFEEIAQPATALTATALTHVSYIITKTLGATPTFSRYDKVMWTGTTKFKIGTADVELYFICKTAENFAAGAGGAIPDVLKPADGVLVGTAWTNLAYPAADADPAALAADSCRTADAGADTSTTVSAIGQDIGTATSGWSYLLERATQVNSGNVARGTYTWDQVGEANTAASPGTGTTLTITGNVAAYSEAVAGTADDFDGIVLSSAAAPAAAGTAVTQRAVVIARLKKGTGTELAAVTYDTFGLGKGAADFICHTRRNVAAAVTVGFADDATFLDAGNDIYGLEAATVNAESDTDATLNANPAAAAGDQAGCPTKTGAATTFAAESDWQLVTVPAP